MSNIAHTHHEVTGDAYDSSNTTSGRRTYEDVGPTDPADDIIDAPSSRTGAGGAEWQRSTVDPSNEGNSNFDNINSGLASKETGERRTSVVNGVETDFETARRASLANLEERRKSSLSSTPGPFNAPTTDDVDKKHVPPTSSVSSQNAPGDLGERAEKIMGVLGVGGAQVERPKEEQGLAEKVVNLLGG